MIDRVMVAWVLFGAGTGTFAISLVALNHSYGASHRSPKPWHEPGRDAEERACVVTLHDLR